MKYDDASWHYGGKFPRGLPKTNGGTHIGMFLAWIIERGFVGEEHEAEAAQELARVRARKMTGTAFLFAVCDEKLTDEDLSAEGNRFARAYFEDEYTDDYLRTFKVSDDGSVYTVADTWGNYERIRKVIDRAYEAFSKKKKPAKKKPAKEVPKRTDAAKNALTKAAPAKEIAFWDVERDLKPYGRDRVLRGQAEGQYTAIIKFLGDNGMFKKKRRTVDASGKLLIRRVFASDLTDVGIAFVKAAHRAWFRSKASAKDPSDTALLQKYLEQVRR